MLPSFHLALLVFIVGLDLLCMAWNVHCISEHLSGFKSEYILKNTVVLSVKLFFSD